MNYIKTLQQENTDLKAKLESVKNSIDLFMAFLQSPKFQNSEGQERKDWISTADVDRWLRDLKKEI